MCSHSSPPPEVARDCVSWWSSTRSRRRRRHRRESQERASASRSSVTSPPRTSLNAPASSQSFSLLSLKEFHDKASEEKVGWLVKGLLRQYGICVAAGDP